MTKTTKQPLNDVMSSLKRYMIDVRGVLRDRCGTGEVQIRHLTNVGDRTRKVTRSPRVGKFASDNGCRAVTRSHKRVRSDRAGGPRAEYLGLEPRA